MWYLKNIKITDKKTMLEKIESQPFHHDECLLSSDSPLFFASDELKKDREVVLAAVKENRKAIYLVDPSFAQDEDFILEVLTIEKDKQGNIIQDSVNYNYLFERADILHHTPRLTSNEAFMLKLIGVSGLMLEYAHPSMQRDRHIVMSAVMQSKGAFYFAHEELKRDKNFVMMLLEKTGFFNNVDDMDYYFSGCNYVR